MSKLTPTGKRDLQRMRWFADAIETNLRWAQNLMVYGYAKKAWSLIAERSARWFS